MNNEDFNSQIYKAYQVHPKMRANTPMSLRAARYTIGSEDEYEFFSPT